MKYDYSTTGELQPIKDKVIVTDIEEGMTKTQGGIIISDDDGTDKGIRPRWAKVCAMGPDQKIFKVDQWVLVKHGRWTRGIKTSDDQVVRMVEAEAILLTCDDDPRSANFL